MRWTAVLGIVLLVLGVASFVWGGIPYTKKEKVVDIGPIEATAEKKERVSLPPAVGLLFFAGGIALLVAGTRRAPA